MDQLHLFDKLIDNETKQLKEKYALLASILFLPFCQKEDLHSENETFWEAFTAAPDQK